MGGGAGLEGVAVRWRELHFPAHGPNGTTYRWRCREVDEHGKPLGLEVEGYDAKRDEWRPVKPVNLLDFFRIGFMARGKATGQEELFA